ncbi:mRNA N(3)-methylcytidine methyltransferase METTL8 isoform X2 [Dunckerocampus dactyliophorus]|uniref:mRNA N(3)-methylcytidine methyltransferase METTL8 isoform X2 n=1 Tax=Dunckerocampus dactyliophorus TaxID=161453 RepID=UPI002405D0C8|nr:mRNA N(3)-methylcytidine methyltransferase METTL8 isoform X2 [Dunckerocampus dactyliophorus]
MHQLRRLCLATLAKVWSVHRVSTRLKCTEGRPSAPLGSRILTNPDDIFKHNMWDHVQWTEEDVENAQLKAEENSSVQIPLREQATFDTEACRYWDRFYELHRRKFFKDRKWLLLEFPELLPPDLESQARSMEGDARHPQLTLLDCNADPRQRSQDAEPETNQAAKRVSYPGQHAPFRILEVGCGVGNSVFPLVNNTKEKGAFLYCCDFSPCALQLLKGHPDYDDSVCHAFIHDICEEEASLPFPPHSLDVILAVFVLSSIHPERMQGVVNRLSSYLKYGGILLFRDYGRYDFSQLRFKKGLIICCNQVGACQRISTHAAMEPVFTFSQKKKFIIYLAKPDWKKFRMWRIDDFKLIEERKCRCTEYGYRASIGNHIHFHLANSPLSFLHYYIFISTYCPKQHIVYILKT